jgi:hypothetical protein
MMSESATRSPLHDQGLARTAFASMLPSASARTRLDRRCCGGRLEPRRRVLVAHQVPPLRRRQIDARVTNVSGSTLNLATGSTGARLILGKDGFVVATSARNRGTGVHMILEPDGFHDYRSTVNLERCDRALSSVAVPAGTGSCW